MKNKKNSAIKVIKDGPYIVIGDVVLKEEIITSNNNDYKRKPGRTFAKGERYTLCRYGESKNKPFCDARHILTNFTNE